MAALPPAVTEMGLKLVKAMVKVGPPLFCRGPRNGLPIIFPEPAGELSAFVIDPSSTRLLRLVPIVPLPLS